MPVYLRKFYISKLLEAKKKERTEMEKARKKSKTTHPGMASKFKK